MIDQNQLKIKNNFFSDGFVVVRKIFPKNQIQKVLRELKSIKKKSLQVKNKNMHFTRDKKLNTIHDINTYIKKGEVVNFTKDKKLLKVVNNILGEKSKVRNIEFFLKPKRTGMKSPFHQDNFYWNIQNKKALNVWIACTESNFKNGGMCYYKNSHKKGLYNHILSHEPGSSQKVPDKFIKSIKAKKVYPHLNPGDAIFHHCEVLHGSKANKSNRDRIGLVISFKGISAKINKAGLKKYKRMVQKNLQFLKTKKYEN